MERRKRARFVERNDACITSVCEKPDGGKVNAYTHDLSTGGARVLTKDRLEAGALINIRIDLAGTGESVVLAAAVRWARFNDQAGLYESGVEFRHLSSQKVLSLIKHLYRHNKAAPTSAG